MQKALSLFEKGPLALVAGEGFEPSTSGLWAIRRLSLSSRAVSGHHVDLDGLAAWGGLWPAAYRSSQAVPQRLVYKSVYGTVREQVRQRARPGGRARRRAVAIPGSPPSPRP